MGLHGVLGELAFLAMPSLDPAPNAAPQWAKRLRVSFKLLKRGKREPKPASKIWAPRLPSYAPSGQDLKRLAMQQQALNNAMYADYMNDLRQGNLAGLQNSMRGSGDYRSVSATTTKTFTVIVPTLRP